MKTARFGSLYLDGEAAEPMSECEGIVDIALGDTVPGNELLWIQDEDHFITDRCVCSIVSWDQLNKSGYIYGRPVKIDGKPYLCRCLKGGAQRYDPNEWDDLGDKYGADDDLWHGNLQYFWCQEKKGARWQYAVVVPACAGAAASDAFRPLPSSREGGSGIRPAGAALN